MAYMYNNFDCELSHYGRGELHFHMLKAIGYLWSVDFHGLMVPE
jgi:hypothetical protein